MDTKKILTKTIIMKGFQCEKHLFLSLNKPEEAEAVKSDQAKEIGITVGEFARNLFKNGKLVNSAEIKKSLDETNNLINQKCPVIFEAAFLFQNFYCRVDILELLNEQEVIINEVKASSHKKGDRLKEHHVVDAIVQSIILESLGYSVKKINLLLLNKEYTLNNGEELFVVEDITETARSQKDQIKKEMEYFLTVVNQENEPYAAIGSHCNSPHECPFKNFCKKQKKIPDISVLSIQNFNKKYKFLEEGIVKPEDLNISSLTENQRDQVRKLQLTEPEFKKNEINKIFNSWRKPLYFLDFEAFSLAIPIFENSNPFSKIPYQFSCFALEKGEIIHKASYVVDSIKEDPRRKIAYELVKALGSEGSIVVYNQGFERSVVRDLIGVVPELRSELENILLRLVDLLELVKKHVYFPEFKNQFSIKVVAPVMLGEKSSYKNLKIQNGLESVDAFLTAVENGTLHEIIDALIEYCDKDVLEMIGIFQYIEKAIK